MMKHFVFIVVLLQAALFLNGQTDTLKIKGHTYVTIKQVVKNDYGKKDTLLKFYRLEHGVKAYLLAHYLYMYGEDCNNTYRNIGKIECHEDSVIFMTDFFQKGYDPIPERQKETYRVSASGKLIPLSNRVYWNGKWIDAKHLPVKVPGLK